MNNMMQENFPILISVKCLKPEFEKFKKILITSEEFTIGRSLENNVVLTYLAISRKHCKIKKINNIDWALEDYSSFGIEVNKQKLKKGVLCKLSHEDTIQLDPTGDFIYKFIYEKDEECTPSKRMKIEEPSLCNDDTVIQDVRSKFEESQNFEIQHIEEKIQTAKQMQTTSKILKQQLELDMARKIQQLQNDFAVQIENLQGEKNEVEKQKSALEEERDAQLVTMKVEMEDKIADLMNQIQKHNETESDLLKENSSLKEKLLKEREEFLAELERENSSKQDLLDKLNIKMKEQEEMRLKEKQELENELKAKTELLMQAKETELKQLEEQKKQREAELELELTAMRTNLEEQLTKTANDKAQFEQDLNQKVEQMRKLSEEEKTKLEQLLKEKEETEKQMTEAQAEAEKKVEDFRQQMRERETELAALAAQRIQQQSEQSTEVITSLQEQLEKVRSQLHLVESEKNTLLQSICTDSGDGSSKQATLAEVGDLMESELQCSICAELFVESTTLNCSHTFCKYCITQWKRKKKDCPICRASITSECRSLVLDSFIEKMVANLTDEVKQKREAMLKDRQELNAELARNASASTSRGRSNSDAGSEHESYIDYDSELVEEEEEYYDFGERYRSYDTDSGSNDPTSDSENDGPATGNPQARRRGDRWRENALRNQPPST